MNRGESYPGIARLVEGIASAGFGVIFQGCRKQDVFSRAYTDVFTAARKDNPETRTAVKSAHAVSDEYRVNGVESLNTQKVFGIATGSEPKGIAVTQELQIETA